MYDFKTKITTTSMTIFITDDCMLYYCMHYDDLGQRALDTCITTTTALMIIDFVTVVKKLRAPFVFCKC